MSVCDIITISYITVFFFLEKINFFFEKFTGDVTLTNLEVKETALDDFDLPFKLKFGYLSTLILKIPWKSLYTEPVIANVEGF